MFFHVQDDQNIFYNHSLQLGQILDEKMVPKVTNPPFVLKSSNGSPLNSGGGIGAQQHGGTLTHFFELPTSVSSYNMVINSF